MYMNKVHVVNVLNRGTVNLQDRAPCFLIQLLGIHVHVLPTDDPSLNIMLGGEN